MVNMQTQQMTDDLTQRRRLAESLLNSGKFSQGIRLLQELAEAHADNAELHHALGRAFAKVGHHAAAVQSYHQSLLLSPHLAAVHFDLATTLTQQGKYERAIDSFQESLRLQPDNLDASLSLAATLRILGRRLEGIQHLQQIMPRHPRRPEVVVTLANLLLELGRNGQAIELLKQLVRANPRAASVRRALIAALLHSQQPEPAQAACEEALAIDPQDVDGHLLLAVAYARRQRTAEAIASYEQALMLFRRRPSRWQPEFSREVAELGLKYEASIAGRSSHSSGPATSAKVLTIIIGCYGNFPQYSLRAMNSIASGRNLQQHCDVAIGLNACCAETIQFARQLQERGLAGTVVQSTANLNKDPMMRLLIATARTPYVMWLDDDSHFTDAGWPDAIARFIEREHPFDAAGQHARWGPRRDLDPAYMNFIRARPWWNTDVHQPEDLREWVPFVVGGLFLGRTDFLRQHDFPDAGMTKAMDDVALGELMHQVGGRLVGLPGDILSMMKISDGDRRGENYEL